MHSLSIFGTSSDAGKSTLSFAITYLLHKRGIKVAPFKAQNVSNNAVVTDEPFGEIAIPQAFAAEACGLKTTPLFNPILLKSGGKSKAHMIINGKSIGDCNVWEYYRDIKRLKPVVKSALRRLLDEYECLVAEGAGSPVELNLMDKDLSNLYVAKKLNSKIIIVADIERGGVFASVYGVYKLLPKKLRKNVIGVVINKFRGDMRLFDKGVTIIEKRFGIAVLGVVPYKSFNLAFEDSASLLGYTQDLSRPTIRVSVIHLPHISNFTDFEPLVADREIALEFVTSPTQAQESDLLIIPGSKRVVDDLFWLRERGFEPLLQEKKRKIIGICGGYEMLFERLVDTEGVESSKRLTQGLGRFRGDVVFQKEKIVAKGCYKIFGVMLKGYEIHNGHTKKRSKTKGHCHGTFVHGIFESDALRKKIFTSINPHYKGYNFNTYKQNEIESFANHIQKHVKIEKIVQELQC